MKILRRLVVCLMLCALLVPSSMAEGRGGKTPDSKTVLQNRYKKLKRECKKRFAYDGSQSEMTMESLEEYQLWDKELNYVYKKVRKGLSRAKKAALKKSELKWIKKRDASAKEAAAAFAGGTAQPMIYNMSLTASTKSRIQRLISKYAG